MNYRTYIENLIEAQRFYSVEGLTKLKKYAGKPNIFISYRDINKLGINPDNRYNTPYGIYAYPLDEYLDKMRSSMDVPYAGKHPYIHVFTVKPEFSDRFIVDVYNYSSSDYDRDFKKLEQFAKSLTQMPYISPNTHADPSELNDEEEKELIEKYSNVFNLHTYMNKQSYPAVKNPFGTIWYYTRLLAQNASEFSIEYKKSEPTMVWNVILRKVLGYCGICDRGQGIIHPSEPTQAVFFSKECIEEIEVIRNITDRSTVTDVAASFGGLSRTVKNDIEKVLYRNSNIVVVRVNLDYGIIIIVRRLSDNKEIHRFFGTSSKDWILNLGGRDFIMINRGGMPNVITILNDEGEIEVEIPRTSDESLSTFLKLYEYDDRYLIRTANRGNFDLWELRVFGQSLNTKLLFKNLYDMNADYLTLIENKLIILEFPDDKLDQYSVVYVLDRHAFYDLVKEKFVIHPDKNIRYIDFRNKKWVITTQDREEKIIDFKQID